MAIELGSSEFSAVAEASSARTPRELLEHSGLLQRWRAAVRGALTKRHLVDVASELAGTCGFDETALEIVGVPVDLLQCFPQWRHGRRTPFKAPPARGLRLAPVGAGLPIGTLRLQMSPTRGTVPYALRLLRDLLLTLDSSVRFVVVVEPGADIDALSALARRFHPSAASRVRFVALRCISVFAQDNARSARDADGQPILLVPRAFRADGPRAEDEMAPADAEAAFGMPVRRSLLYWEGGNIVHDESWCFVGVDTIAENAARLGLARAETLALLEAEFGMPVVPLGRVDEARFDLTSESGSKSGQASFHIDLDVSLFGRFGRASRPRAVVADAARGLDFVDRVLAMRRLVDGHFLSPRDIRRHLRAEYESSAAARHPVLLEYAATLASHGYRVVGVPDLRIDPKMDVFQRVNLDFGFCNILPGLRDGRAAAYHFISGVRALDADAARRFALAGVKPVPVSTPEVASALRLLQGGLHCCCGSL